MLPLLAARRSTRRLAVVGAIFVVVGIMLVPTLRAYLQQRDEHAALAQRVEQQQRTVDELQRELEQWQDPAFIEAQARARLTFVYPGETAYQVIDLDRIAPAVRQPPPGTPRPGTELTPYYATVLDSLRSIDQGRTAPARETGNLPPPAIAPSPGQSSPGQASPSPSGSATAGSGPSGSPTASPPGTPTASP